MKTIHSRETFIHHFLPSNSQHFNQIGLSMSLENTDQLQTPYSMDHNEFSAPSKVSDLPKTQPPTPQNSVADVFSIFSDSYPPLPQVNLHPNWGQKTQHSILKDSLENSLLKYIKLNREGIDFAPIDGGLDISQMTHLHIDYYVVSAVDLQLSLISNHPITEVSYPLPTHQKKRWIIVWIFRWIGFQKLPKESI